MQSVTSTICKMGDSECIFILFLQHSISFLANNCQLGNCLSILYLRHEAKLSSVDEVPMRAINNDKATETLKDLPKKRRYTQFSDRD